MKNKKLLSKELVSKRVFFRTASLRNEFFAKLREEFGTWTNLRKHLNIYKSRLEKFINGKISIPYNILLDLSEYLNRKDKKKFLSRIRLKDQNWGRVKGGISTYKKHKEIFEKGRKIARKKTRYHFDFNIPLTPQLCEFLGAFIGDGFTNKYGSVYVTQITGDLKLDYEYYTNTLMQILKKISPSSNPKIFRIDNTARLTVYSKELYVLLTNRFKFKRGKKVYFVMIPKEIIESKNIDLINSCLRGVFDTDGSVYFDKRYKKPYIRIGLQMLSKNLMKQIFDLLSVQGIKTTITKDLKKIQINGSENCKKFMKIVGFSNPRHLKKISNI